jgi:TATA-box binding protein (TBP) (component of TFIID and TFIIIB)
MEYEIIPSLGIESLENVVRTVFHTEYTYGDFMGKLVPITKGKDVRYKFCEGHFLIVPAKSYQKIIEKYQDIIENIKNIDFK